jgi:hypothetical protein
LGRERLPPASSPIPCLTPTTGAGRNPSVLVSARRGTRTSNRQMLAVAGMQGSGGLVNGAAGTSRGAAAASIGSPDGRSPLLTHAGGGLASIVNVVLATEWSASNSFSVRA